MRIQPRDLDRLGVPVTTEAMLIFTVVWPSFESRIEAFARRLAHHLDDREDLVQEAMITLWKCDPTAYDFLDPKDMAYLRRAMVHRMCDVWGRNRQYFEARNAAPAARDGDGRKLVVEENVSSIMPPSHIRALVAQLQGR